MLNKKASHEPPIQLAFSPLARKGAVITKLDRGDLNARLQKRQLLVKRDTITKAIKYIEEDDFAHTSGLIEKWKVVAQMALSYLLNDLQSKINKMGGKAEWKKSCKETTNSSCDQLERLDSMKLFAESPGFGDLSKYEQSEFQKCIDKLEDECYGPSSDGSETSEEFTMLDMYDLLKLDHGLIFDS